MSGLVMGVAAMFFVCFMFWRQDRAEQRERVARELPVGGYRNLAGRYVHDGDVFTPTSSAAQARWADMREADAWVADAQARHDRGHGK